jgi:membrane fusion protein (multidrug efflux system)
MNTLTLTAPTHADYTAAAPSAVPAIETTARKRGSRLPWGRILAGATLVATVAMGAGIYFYRAAGFESTDDAFVEANVHPVSPRINGTVLRVLVEDNAHVQAGDPLVEIDPADLNITVQGAEADVAQARANAKQVLAQIDRAQAEVEAATARIAQNAAQLTRVEVDFHRMEKLVSDQVGAISRQEFDTARAKFEAAQATEQSLMAERTSAQAALGAMQAQQSVSQAQIQKAESLLAAAKLQADYTVIRAPNSGRVARKNVEVGQRLQPGQPVLAIVSDQVWVVANFKESQLTHLRAGEKVSVKVDAIEGRTFNGVVESFSPGTGAKFSLLPPDNSTGNFTKIVQRVPVKILFTPDSLGADASRFAPGLSVLVEVATRN